MNTDLNKEFLDFLEEKKKKAQEEADRLNDLINQARSAAKEDPLIIPTHSHKVLEPVVIQDGYKSMGSIVYFPQTERNPSSEILSVQEPRTSNVLDKSIINTDTYTAVDDKKYQVEKKRRHFDRNNLRDAVHAFMAKNDYLTHEQIAEGIDYDSVESKRDISRAIEKILSRGALMDPPIYKRKKSPGQRYMYKFEYPKRNIVRETGIITYLPDAMKGQMVFANLKSAIISCLRINGGEMSSGDLYEILSKTLPKLPLKHENLLIASISSTLNQISKDKYGKPYVRVHEYGLKKKYSYIFGSENDAEPPLNECNHYGLLSWAETRDYVKKYMDNNRFFLSPKSILRSVSIQTTNNCSNYEPALVQYLDNLHKQNPMLLSRRGNKDNFEYKLNDGSVMVDGGVDFNDHIGYNPSNKKMFVNLNNAIMRVLRKADKPINIDSIMATFKTEIPKMTLPHSSILRSRVSNILDSMSVKTTYRPAIFEMTYEEGKKHYIIARK